jgi:two-component system response regulator AtoC
MHRILVVDDQPDALLAARAALVAAGHECVLAADGERALELLAGGGFDLVVIDPAMPLHDGWPVLAAAVGAVPVIAVSSAGALAGRPGVAAQLPKPCAAADLIAAAEAALGG